MIKCDVHEQYEKRRDVYEKVIVKIVHGYVPHQTDLFSCYELDRNEVYYYFDKIKDEASCLQQRKDIGRSNQILKSQRNRIYYHKQYDLQYAKKTQKIVQEWADLNALEIKEFLFSPVFNLLYFDRLASSRSSTYFLNKIILQFLDFL